MKLTRFLGRSPDTATNEDLRRFQLHLTENRAGAPIINSTVSAVRFFFTVTLDRADAANGRCRMHGGTSPGAPKSNGHALKHGRYTAEAIAEQREFAALVCAI